MAIPRRSIPPVVAGVKQPARRLYRVDQIQREASCGWHQILRRSQARTGAKWRLLEPLRSPSELAALRWNSRQRSEKPVQSGRDRVRLRQISASARQGIGGSAVCEYLLHTSKRKSCGGASRFSDRRSGSELNPQSEEAPGPAPQYQVALRAAGESVQASWGVARCG